MMDVILVAVPTTLCDFCSSPEIRWEYPARDFTTDVVRSPDGGTVTERALGAWRACDECHRLIEAGDFGGLAARSLAMLPVPVKPGREEWWRAQFRELHQQFAEARTGPVVSLGNFG